MTRSHGFPSTRRLLGTMAVLLGLFLIQSVCKPAADAAAGEERLTSRPRAEAPALKPIAVGDEIRTEKGLPRRVLLPDGSVLYVKDQTSLKLTAERSLKLAEGEIFVDAAPARKGAEAAFVVQTPQREVSGLGTKFAVRSKNNGTGVVVVQGKVKVSGLDKPLVAGQQLAPREEKVTPAPRASHLLDWTRELMATAESPLVPASQHAGGALIAIDPNGQEAKLSLRKYHIDIHIEDGFARTTIDQTYFNHESRRLEGTFYFPLPADASLSRLAMYVDGNLMEGGMVERDYGRAVYESIVHRQKDPALLEWVDGSTFKMRVFPLEGRQEKRIVLSYTQKLPALYGQVQYRFPAGHSLELVRDWSVHARVKNGAGLTWSSASHTMKAGKDGSDLLLDASDKNIKFDRDVVLSIAEREGTDEVSRFSSAEQDGAKYLMLRYRTSLPSQSERGAAGPQSWVFLFESSGDRDPLLARVQIEIIRSLLSLAEPDDTFAMLTAGTRVKALAAKPQAVTPENVQAAVTFLESAHLIGALDLGKALTEAEPFLKAGKNPYLVHVGSGIAAMGERRDDVLAKRLPDGTRYVGVGVGRRWARSFMKAAAERTGGYFTQINPDEPISWRTFELAATLNTPRLMDVQVTDKAGKALFLNYVNSLAQGEELAAVARLGLDDKLPESVVVTGTLDGKPYRRELPVKDPAPKADYLPRTWAKLEIDRLLAEDAVKHKDAIIKLSKAMYVMTPFTSLLVLENEDMYEQYKVDRGRKDHWAMYNCPQKIKVVHEPVDGQPADPGKGIKPSAKQVLATIAVRSSPRLLQWSSRSVDEPPVQFPPAATWGGKPAGFINDFSPERMVGTPQDVFQTGQRGINAIESNDAQLRSQLLYRNNSRSRDSRIVAQRGLIDVDGSITEARGRFPADLPRELTKVSLPAFTEAKPGLRLALGGGGIQDIQEQISDRQDQAIKMLKNAQALPHGGVAGVSFIFGDGSGESLQYHRPRYSGNEGIFYDLVAYAPGMNTSWADIQAVLEAEAESNPRSAPGQIDRDARELIDKARATGWQSLTIPAEAGQPACTIVFDGSGRYAYERTLSIGLRERVVCDGKTLLHLYPDLGIGARRTVSRFHRLDFAQLVPWAVPAAEDLARGADLKVVGERTVAVIPHGAESAKDKDGKPVPYSRLHLIFAEDGRLAERHVVEMPAKKTLYREICSADGTVKLLDADGKERATHKATLGTAKAPELTPDTKKLVVLPLPFRMPDHVRITLKLEKKHLDELRFEEALALFAAEFGANKGPHALQVFQRCFHNRDQRQLGFYVLLAACGQNLDAEHDNVLEEHMNEPLAQYLALYSSPVLRKHASQWAVVTGQWAGGFLQHLAVSHALYQRWQNPKAGTGSEAQRKAERDKALEYVRKNKGSAFGWALLGLLQDRAGDDKAFHGALAEAWLWFEDMPGLRSVARYEHARSLWKAGRRDEARKQFRELYEKTLKEDALPLIDADFREALLGDGKEADLWSDLMRQTAARLIEQKHRPAVLALALQCWQLGDELSTNQLLATALDNIKDEKEQLPMTLAGIQFLMHTHQLAQADQMLQKLLDDPKLAKQAYLWRLAAGVADQREMFARELECLERAVDAEYHDLPEIINLDVVRSDYRRLLNHYRDLADAMVTLKVKPPPDFLAKVVRTADRWRALDREGDHCDMAARILQTLGQRELVWDYLTTPVGLQVNESGPWVRMAQTLSRQGEMDLADRAFAAAFEAEPTNAEILWDRAQHLRQVGKTVEAQKLYRQLAEGTWQQRFNWIQQQARRQLGNR